MRKKLVVLVAAVMMVVMAAAPAWAAPGNNGKGAAKANSNAAQGISTAVEHSGVCDVC